jgi:hypothetical protein
VLQALGGIDHRQEEVAQYIRRRCWYTTQCIRTMTGLCRASHSEDRLGTAQLSDPNIGMSLQIHLYQEELEVPSCG